MAQHLSRLFAQKYDEATFLTEPYTVNNDR